MLLNFKCSKAHNYEFQEDKPNSYLFISLICLSGFFNFTFAFKGVYFCIHFHLGTPLQYHDTKPPKNFHKNLKAYIYIWRKKK
jgi:hypothetical protein